MSRSLPLPRALRGSALPPEAQLSDDAEQEEAAPLATAPLRVNAAGDAIFGLGAGRTEGPAPGLAYAGVRPRLLQLAVDVVLIGLALRGAAVAAHLGEGRLTGLAGGLAGAALFAVVGLLYEVGFVGFRGATPGMYLLGLHVVDAHDLRRPEAGAAFVRGAFVALPLAAVGGLGPPGLVVVLLVGLACLPPPVDVSHRGLHDRAGHVVVVTRC